MSTLNDAFKKFLLIKTASMRSDETIKWYKSIVGAMVAEIGHECDVTNISEDVVLQYVASLRNRDTRYQSGKQKPMQEGGLSSDSISSHIRALKAFWSWAEKRYKVQNPMEGIKLPKQPPRKPKAIDPSDFVKLFNAISDETCICPQRDRALLALLADSGARRAGITSLTTKIDTIRRIATVTEKGMKQREISWTYFTSQLLDKWLAVRPATDNNALFVSVLDGLPLQPGGINQMLSRLKIKAGVTGRTNPHSYRHGFAIQYLLSGGDLATLSQILGHESSDITATFYAIFTQQELSRLQDEHSPLLRMLEGASNA